ncbi:MAG TPA: hypothetical protein VIG33_12745, partial [Pseudobdellovibrionaceae bacterium]
MIFLKNSKIVGCVAIMSVLGCANRPQKVTELDKPRTSYTEEAESRDITNEAAKKSKAHNFVEINFNPRSAVLSDDAKTSLKKIIEEASQAGRITEILVLSWADQDFPSEKIQQLPKDQRQLAEKRNTVIETYMNTLRSGKVDTYNMAEQANILSKWFKTSDSQLKESLLEAGLPTTADSFRYPSKASHSVIFV